MSLEYAKACKMRVGLVHELAMSLQEIPIQGIAGNTNALCYVVIKVQIGGIPSYNEEQVTLVIEDISGLGMRVPVILGMPTIHRLCHEMKESEIESAPDEWQHALCSYEASQGIFLQAMMLGTDNKNGIKYPTNTGQNPMDLDEPIILTEKIIIPAFASQIVKAHMKKTFMQGYQLNVMVQLPYPEDEARLLVGLYVQHVYMELKDGNQSMSRNGTGKSIHLASGRLIGRIVAANAVSDAIILPELEKKLAEEDREKLKPLTMEECQKLLMEVLDKNGSLGKLEGWSAKNALKAKCLLMEFHHVFCLEEGEMGVTDTTEHVIELLPGQDEPFKERFCQIAPHDVEEVQQHVQEMLDGGAIRLLQSLWCNAIVLVWKKDGTLQFCIDF